MRINQYWQPDLIPSFPMISVSLHYFLNIRALGEFSSVDVPACGRSHCHSQCHEIQGSLGCWMGAHLFNIQIGTSTARALYKSVNASRFI